MRLISTWFRVAEEAVCDHHGGRINPGEACAWLPGPDNAGEGVVVCAGCGQAAETQAMRRAA
jgi:hypothetical protein